MRGGKQISESAKTDRNSAGANRGVDRRHAYDIKQKWHSNDGAATTD
jgi:hypothetical protein